MKQYFDYLLKVNSRLRDIACRESELMLWLYLDSTYCLFRHGCLINQYDKGGFYKLSAIVRRQSFTQRRLERVIRRFNTSDGIDILNNKGNFNTYFSDFVFRRWIACETMTKGEFEDFKVGGGSDKIFVKPLDDMEGRGIRILNREDMDNLYDEFVGKKIILEEAITQSREMDFGNKSVNTIRILTVTDPVGKAYVISAGLRAGTGNAVIDNFSAGGVLYEIDPQTGVVDHKGIQGDNYDVVYHPGSTMCMPGFRIPNWEKVLAGVIRAAEMLPQCRFIGWDVAITDNGIELIEGNHNPGLFTLESLGTSGLYSKAMDILDNPTLSQPSSPFRRLRRYSRIIKLFNKKMGNSSPRPTLVDCLWAILRYGCVINHYLYGNFYRLSGRERADSFTYRHWCRFVPKANHREAIHYLKNKVDFNNFFSEFIKRDWLYSKDMTFEQYKRFALKHDRAIIKPMDGLEGEGIYVIKFDGNDTNLKLEFEKMKSAELLMEEVIQQHPAMIFGNKSVNTIRVYTIYNKPDKKVVILKTVVRAGIGDSIVDNSHAGGCAYEVNRETGKIISPSYCANGLVTEIHPGTDIKMTARQIPFWPDVLDLCTKAAKKLPQCRFIGWDVAITETGPLLIEGNHQPDLDMIEFVGSHGYLPIIARNLKD